mmetsp:Transcript_29705/g.69898  ORF Transcript_29705/g.69898 Transcript_29705/m.69898 type:complete len:203 (+) Transcript_29705:121-729(+)
MQCSVSVCDGDSLGSCSSVPADKSEEASIPSAQASVAMLLDFADSVVRSSEGILPSVLLEITGDIFCGFTGTDSVSVMLSSLSTSNRLPVCATNGNTRLLESSFAFSGALSSSRMEFNGSLYTFASSGSRASHDEPGLGPLPSTFISMPDSFSSKITSSLSVSVVVSVCVRLWKILDAFSSHDSLCISSLVGSASLPSVVLP